MANNRNFSSLNFTEIPGEDLYTLGFLKTAEIKELMELGSKLFKNLEAVRVIPQQVLKEDKSKLLNIERLVLWDVQPMAGSSLSFLSNGESVVIKVGKEIYTIDQARAIVQGNYDLGSLNSDDLPQSGTVIYNVAKVKANNKLLYNQQMAAIDLAMKLLTAAKESITNGQAAWNRL